MPVAPNRNRKADFETPAPLTPKMWLALESLVQTGIVTHAAAAAKVTPKTVYLWIKQPAFVAEYRAARRRLVEAAVVTLQRHVDNAAKTLLAVMLDKSTPPAVRVTAAGKVLETALRAVELEDFAARLDALETAQGEGTG